MSSSENKKRKSFEEIYDEVNNGTSDQDFGVDDDYINSFLDDANAYLNNAYNDYSTINAENAKSLYDTKSGESAALKSRAFTIRAYLNANKDNINAEYRQNLLNYLDDFTSASDSVFNSYRKASENYSYKDREQTDGVNNLLNVSDQFKKTEGEVLPELTEKAITDYEASELALDGLSSNPSEEEIDEKISKIMSLKAGASRRGKDTSTYDEAIAKLQAYEKSGAAANNSSVEELQEKIDEPVVTMEDLDLNDEETVSKYLNHDREAVDFFMDYQSGKLSHTEGNNERYQSLVDTIELSVNNANSANSRYNTGREVALTDDTGRSINYDDLIKHKVAQNRQSDIATTPEKAKDVLNEISDGGSRDLTTENDVSGDDLRSAGWDTTADSIVNYSKAYSNEQHKTAAVFSPVVYNDDGSVKKILTPDELEEYANAVLSGAGDTLGLKLTDTYSGRYASSLAEENSQRIRRLSERYYNDTDYSDLLELASGENHGENTVENSFSEEAIQKLKELGVDYEDYAEYEKLKEEKEKNQERTEGYSDWSTKNVGTGALATAANILMSPIQALEYIGNLGQELADYLSAGTNETSTQLLPNIDDDIFTNLNSSSSEAISNAIRNSIQGDGNNDFLDILGELASQTYGGVTSALQSAMVALTCKAILPPSIAEAVSLGVIAGEAANNAYHDVIDEGGTIGQATAYSAIAGANEVISEKISIEGLLNIKDVYGKSTAKEVLITALKQSVSEASEEATSEALNEFADRIINGDKSTYEKAVKQYLDEGYSDEEAKNKASIDFLSRVAWSAYGGAVGGGFSTEAAVLTNTAQNSINNYQTGKSITSAENVQSLLDTASNITGNSEEAKAIQAQKNKVEQLYADFSTGDAAAAENNASNTATGGSGVSSSNNVSFDTENNTSKRLNTGSNTSKSVNTDTDSSSSSKKSTLSEKVSDKVSESKLSYETGKLYSMVQEYNASTYDSALDDERKQAIRETYASQIKAGQNDGSVDIATEAINKYMFTDEELTDREQRIISTPASQKTMRAVQQNSDLIHTQANQTRQQSIGNLNRNKSLTQSQTQTEELGDVDIDDYSISKDDKTYVKGTEEAVEVGADIVGISKNDVKVKLSNGKTESVKNLDLASEDQAVAYESVLDIQKNAGVDLTPSAANMVYHVLTNSESADNVELAQRRVSIQEALEKGLSGDTVAYSADNVLTKSERQAIYDEGRRIANRNASTKQTEVNKNATGTRREGSVSFVDGIQRSRLSTARKTDVEFIENLSQSLGYDTVIFRSTKGSSGKYQSKFITENNLTDESGQAPNGFWHNGKVYIDINSSNLRSEGLMLFTASHELTHMMEDYAPEHWKAYADFIVKNYVKKGVSVRSLVLQEMGRHTKLNYDQAFREVIAKSSEAMLRDTHLNEKSKAFYKENPGTWEKVKDALSRMIARLKAFYTNSKLQSAEARFVSQWDISTLEKAQDRWVKGIVAASENLSRTKNTATEGGVKFMIRETEDGKQFVVADRKVIKGNDSSKWGGQVTNYINEQIRKGKDVIVYAKDGDALTITRDTAGKAQFRNRIKTGENQYRDMTDEEYAVKLRAETHIDELSQVSKRGNKIVPDNKNHSFAKDGFNYRTAYFMDFDGAYYRLTISVGKNGRINTVYNVGKIKETERPLVVQRPSRVISTEDELNSVSTNIISDSSKKSNTSTIKKQSRDTDYLTAVENGDMDTAQRMVDKAAEAAFANSKVRGEDGKLIKVYHGTDADFTVFDKAMGRSNMDIQGMFFSPWDLDAKGYGSNVRGFYLNITNPASESIGYQALNSHKGENYAGIKAREDLERMGYDGVNNSDEEYIAFESAQIKSADPVTYDDNGKVIPLSQRFDSTKKDIRYQGRDEFDIDLFEDDDSVENIFAKEYATHHEDIGEVLKNIEDIELPSKKIDTIVNRIIRGTFGDIDAETRKTLSVELQMAMENTDNPEQISNDMIAAVRKAIDGATVTDERAEANYKDLLSVFKGNKYFLSDEQIADLGEHDMTLKEYKDRMFNKISIIKQESAERSVGGGYKNAQQLSLESLYEVLESPEEYLPYRADQWDELDYHAPIILMDTLEKLRDSRTVALSEMASVQDIDDIAVDLTAKITGAIVEAKYNSKQNPYVSKLVDKLKTQRTEAVQKQKAKAKEKLKELKQKERERAKQREQELRENFRESRAKGRENRQRAEIRNKIRNLASRFEQRLTKPKGQQYVPQQLISQTVDVLNAINLDTGRSTKLSEKIAALRNTYDGMKEDNLAYAAYDNVISTMLRNLSDNLGDTSIMDMSLSQLRETYDVLRSMDQVIRDAVRMVDTEFKKTCHQLGREMIAETAAVPKNHSGVLSGYVQSMLSAERMFNRLGGFKKDSTWHAMFEMLNNGQLHMTQLEMEFSQLFDELVTDTKNLKTLSDTKRRVDVGLKDEDGNTVKITRGMMISLYMHLLNEDNARHVLGGGLTVPSMKQYYKGDVKKAFGEGQQSVRADLEYDEYIQGLKSKIEEELTEYDIKWIEQAHEFFDVASRNALNDTTMKLYGFKKAKVDNYFPIHTDASYRAAEFESITRDMSLENSGFMKDRVKASNPIMLEDIVDVVNSQIDKVSKYCGMTIPIKNFQKVYGTTTRGFETSVQKELNKKFSGSKSTQSATQYIENLITDLTVGRSAKHANIDYWVAKARGNLAQTTLTLNPRVAIAQAASYPTAAAEIGWKPLAKALVKGGKNNHMFSRADRTEIADVTPLLWKRTQGYSNVEIGDIHELRKQKHQIQSKVKKALGWIEFFDGMTVGRLYYACQYYVDEQHPSLKRGTEEYKQKVAEVYNRVIERTQPNYTVMQRPDLLRDPSTLKKTLTMFMTQRLQNFNIVYDAVGTYNKYLSDYRNKINGVTYTDLKEARATLRRALLSQVAAAATIVGVKLIADTLLHSMNGYRDDDDELTAESVGLKLLDCFADSIFGNILYGTDLYSIIKRFATQERYYGLSMSGVDSIVDAIQSITNLADGIDFDKINDVAKSICQLLGIPLSNAEKIGTGIYNWCQDISSGDALSFESGVERSNKQNIHRAEMAYSGGDTQKSNEIIKALIDDKVEQGKTEKEAKSWLKDRLRETYKPRYIEAVENNDIETKNQIRQFLFSTGVYGSLNDLDKSLAKWTK